ncbi:helix-turn-helix domain-containing protein [Mycobacterium sp. KBS0706]|uniref:helix-turn-helix domain-containing protein n=1 Tax=Mycobacterium sp. KBS0706 TaxID=2578109 RepID=UPI00163DD3E0|nr:helix-turn-helix domain-containing protein [Mycobacterium sp. KBS0706]
MANRIKELREAAGLSLDGLAKLVAVDRSTIWKLETGRQKLTVDYLKAIAAALRVDIADVVESRGSEKAAEVSGLAATSSVVEMPRGLELIPVVGAVQAGHWVEALELPEEEWEWISAPVDPRLRQVKRFGLRVNGRSMDLVYPEGTILVCAKLLDLGIEQQPGQRVICLRRSREGLMEATVKEYVVDNGRRLLMPRSSVPAYQQPVELHDPGPDDANGDVLVFALVLGSYRSEI